MTAPLVPCPGCSRHVRASDITCPFCAFGVAARLGDVPSPVLPRRQIPRAALFAFGATVALTGCGDDDDHDHEHDSGPVADMGLPGPLYGAPAPDMGMATPDMGMAGPDMATDPDLGGAAPAYGAPAPLDAGGGMNLYGAPPPPEENDDAAVASLYGLAPPPDGGESER